MKQQVLDMSVGGKQVMARNAAWDLETHPDWKVLVPEVEVAELSLFGFSG